MSAAFESASGQQVPCQIVAMHADIAEGWRGAGFSVMRQALAWCQQQSGEEGQP